MADDVEPSFNATHHTLPPWPQPLPPRRSHVCRFVKKPENSTQGVIVLQEWWGMNESIIKTADEFAQAGFHVLVPDLYRGKVSSIIASLLLFTLQGRHRPRERWPSHERAQLE